MVTVADFGAAAELSLELPPGEAAAIRDEIESELSGVGVSGGGAAGALSNDGGTLLTDGGMDPVAAQLADQTDILTEILDELETGLSGGGGGGGGGLLAPITGGGGGGGGGVGVLEVLGIRELLRGGGGGGGGVGKFIPKLLKRSVGTAVLNVGKGSRLAPGQEREFTGPFSQLQAAAEGVTTITDTLTGGGSNVTTEDTNRVISEAGLELEEPAWVEDFNQSLDDSVSEPAWAADFNQILDNSVSEPGWVEQVEQIVNGGDGGGTQPTATSPTADVDTRPGANGRLQAGTDPNGTPGANRAQENRTRNQTTVENTNNVEVSVNANVNDTRQLTQLLNNPERWVEQNLNISSVGRTP